MKKTIYTTIITSLLIIITTLTCAMEKSEINIKFGDKTITLANPTFMQNNRIYISARDICDTLGIPIYWNEENNEAHIDIYHKKLNVSNKTECKDEGVIPDEETALAVGKVILEKYMDKPLEYETSDKIYYLEVAFKEDYNKWDIYQTFKYKNEAGWNSGELYIPSISLNKYTGEVIHINTYSMIDN